MSFPKKKKKKKKKTAWTIAGGAIRRDVGSWPLAAALLTDGRGSFRGKADTADCGRSCPLMTHSGHRQLSAAFARTHCTNLFRLFAIRLDIDPDGLIFERTCWYTF